MKKITLLILSCILFSAFTSCQSKEESVISKLQAISEQIEEKGKDFGKSVKSILKKGKGIVDGIKEGLKDNDEE
mgnify:CR=1 FL=1